MTGKTRDDHDGDVISATKSAKYIEHAWEGATAFFCIRIEYRGRLTSLRALKMSGKPGTRLDQSHQSPVGHEHHQQLCSSEGNDLYLQSDQQGGGGIGTLSGFEEAREHDVAGTIPAETATDVLHAMTWTMLPGDQDVYGSAHQSQA